MIPGSTNQLLAAGVGYQISRSVRLRSSASAYFNRTPASPGNRRTWTWSAWLKIGAMPASDIRWFSTTDLANSDFALIYQNGGAFRFYSYVTATQADLITSAVFRDPSAWYHFVVSVDTTQATASNRIKIYVNGTQITSFSTSTYPAQNTDLYCNTVTNHNLGRYQGNSQYFDGYFTEINFIDGQALTPSSFGETNPITGVWKPKKYVGTYGTNGFYLNFSDNSNNTAATIGKDYSGNGNNWTPNNISVTAGVTYDSMLDVPTPWGDGGNGRGNYAVLNPLLDWKTNGSAFTLSEGNLRVTEPAGTTYGSVASTIAMPSGKWYCEVTVIAASGVALVGVTSIDSAAGFPGQTASSYAYHQDGRKFNNNTGSSYGATYTANDVIGIAFDADSGSVTFYKNGASQGTAFSSISAGSYYFVVGDFANGVSTFVANFGQRPFSYTPPSGFRALNTQNLPVPTILKGNQYFDASLWTGNGTSQTIVNSGAMQPDLVWAKNRSVTGTHGLFDSLRGVTKRLDSGSTNAEDTLSGVTAFNANGFSLGAEWNASGNNFVGWQWKEGATQGFDIVTFTATGNGQTINHSLGVAPKMIIYKPRNAAIGWTVMHDSLANMTNRTLELNTTSAVLTIANAVSAPTSTTFGCSASVANNTNTMVAYLFSEVAGFSRFGSYPGNGSTDGPFVFCGFRPRWVMVKRTDTTSDWVILDAARDQYNPEQLYLNANSSNAEAGGFSFYDFLSNGFKLRATNTTWNTSGGTYIYAAFCENPFKYSLAR